MKINVLLIGSASLAALAATEASAADPVMAIEPAPANYVEVCDAFGAGYFYIPGTETCLNIGGYVRFETQFGGIQTGSADDSDWSPYTKANFQITAKTDTELGTLTSVMVPEFYVYANGDDSEFKLDNLYVDLGDTVSVRVGYFKSYWNDDLWGELDNIDNTTRYNSVRLAYNADNFVLGVQADVLPTAITGTATPKMAVSGRIGYQPSDSHYARFDFAYDTQTENYALRPWMGFGIGPGTFEIAGLYESGFISFAPDFTADNWNDSPIAGTYMKYAVAANYYFNVTESLILAPQTQYNVASNDKTFWEAGATADWSVVDNFHVRANLNYAFLDDDWNQQNWFGWLRLERDF
ncbi:porin [Martelella soudanensis]|uniref:porin n=1 Tax=unclassified Martelella TaxID=2629616 RepID=UPI0015DF24F8|nr:MULTISPECIES: porin [unclassified Martelella]